MAYTYEYPHFAVTVDAVVLARSGNTFSVLLIQRKNDPFKGKWALPGGYVEIDELTEHAVHRELKEETGITVDTFRRLDVFDKVDRDPRERTISVAYWAIIPDMAPPAAQDDAADARWFSITDLPGLAFDHSDIIKAALTAAAL